MDLFSRAIEAVRVVLVGPSIVLRGLRCARLYPVHVSALAFVDERMPLPPAQAAAMANQRAIMGGPNGRDTREAMVCRCYVAGAAPEVQTKALIMTLGAPEAAAVGARNAPREPAGQTTEIPMVPILGIYAAPSGIASEQVVHGAFPSVEYTSIPGTGPS